MARLAEIVMMRIMACQHLVWCDSSDLTVQTASDQISPTWLLSACKRTVKCWWIDVSNRPLLARCGHWGARKRPDRMTPVRPVCTRLLQINSLSRCLMLPPPNQSCLTFSHDQIRHWWSDQVPANTSRHYLVMPPFFHSTATASSDWSGLIFHKYFRVYEYY